MGVGEGHTDEPQRTKRLTVSQAAAQLGITEGAVRSRIKRGTLRTERESDRVYVLLGEEGRRDEPDDEPSTDRDRLVTSYEDRVASLERQLEAERQAHGEARRLLAAALEKIPTAIEAGAPPEPRESPVTATEQPGREEPQAPIEGPREPAEPRSWWRRWFGS